MQITITARHFEAPDNIRTYVENEVQRLTKVFDRIIDCQVVLDRGKEGDSVDITANISGKSLNASETSDDMIKSVDAAVGKVEKQLKRYKEKFTW